MSRYNNCTCDQKVDIYVQAKTRVCMSSVSDALQERQKKKADFCRIHLSTSCPPGSTLFSHNVHNCTHISVFARHAAALSTGSTCSEENTSDIGKNCLFFPPASLLIRGPLAFTCHTRAGARRDVLVCLHCTQVGLPAVGESSLLAFLLHKSCLKTPLTE